jgi:transposase
LPTKRLLPLIPAGLMVVRILPATERITIVTTPKTRAGTCPGCGTTPTRIHSRYRRTLDDLPWQGRALRIHIRRCVRLMSPR